VVRRGGHQVFERGSGEREAHLKMSQIPRDIETGGLAA